MNILEFKIKTTLSDVFIANLWAGLLKPKTLLILFLFSIFIAYIYYQDIVPPNGNETVNIIFSLILLTGAFLWIITCCFAWLVIITFWNLFKKGSIGEQKLILNDVGLIEHDGYKETITKWKDIRNIEKFKNRILVKIGWSKYHIISGSNFENKSEFLDLEKELIERRKNAT